MWYTAEDAAKPAHLTIEASAAVFEDAASAGRSGTLPGPRSSLAAGKRCPLPGCGLLDHSPAAHVRRPWLDHESYATELDRDELGALLVAADLGPPAEHALISLLALNGLRVSEANGADIEELASSAVIAPSWSPARAVRWSPFRSRLAPPGQST